VRSQVSVGDNAEWWKTTCVQPGTKGWRLTLRLKVKDPSKSTEGVPRWSPMKNRPCGPVTKAEKVAAKAQTKERSTKPRTLNARSAAEAAPATPDQSRLKKS
jgi:periplasmic glucans biosynthesis protein